MAKQEVGTTREQPKRRPQTGFQRSLQQYIDAGYQCLYIPTSEENRVSTEIKHLAQHNPDGMKVITWDCVQGFTGEVPHSVTDDKKWRSPLTALIEVGQETPAFATPADRSNVTILIFRSLKDFWADPSVRRALKTICEENLISGNKWPRRLIVVVSPFLEIHKDLQSCITTLEYALPDEVGMRQQLDYIKESTEETKRQRDHNAESIDLTEETAERITRALLGLTAIEAENLLARCASEHSGFPPEVVQTILNEKANIIGQSKVLTYISEDKTPPVSEIGGYDNLLNFVSRRALSYTKEAQALGIDYPKGITLVGIPGCLHGDTPVYDPIADDTKTAAERHAIGKPFYVVAQDANGEAVIAQADPPEQFPPAEMFEVSFDDGEKMVVTEGHQFGAGDGRYVRVCDVREQLLVSGSCPLPTISGTDLPALLQGVRHLTRTVASSQEHCSGAAYPRGAQLHRAQCNGQVALPSQDGSRAHSRAALHTDGPVASDTRSRPRLSGLRSKPDYLRLTGKRTTRALLLCAVSAFLRRVLGLFRVAQQPATGVGHSDTARQRVAVAPASTRDDSRTQDTGVGTCLPLSDSYRTSLQSRPASYPQGNASGTATLRSLEVLSLASATGSLNGNTKQFIGSRQVVNVEYVGVAPYYDFHVPLFNNYWAVGCFHHNTGKSYVAKGLGRLLGTPVYIMDVGAVFGSLIGESEARMKDALKQIEAQRGCVLVLDEADKSIAGANNTNSDSGVTRRVMGQLLTWLAEKQDRTFVVMTMNRTKDIPAEFLRAGRFDAVFSTDVPDELERRQILEIHFRKRKVKPEELGFNDSDWKTLVERTADYVGSELEEVVKDARYRAFETRQVGVPNMEELFAAIDEVVPLAKRDKDALVEIRKMADDCKPVSSRTNTAKQRVRSRAVQTRTPDVQ